MYWRMALRLDGGTTRTIGSSDSGRSRKSSRMSRHACPLPSPPRAVPNVAIGHDAHTPPGSPKPTSPSGLAHSGGALPPVNSLAQNARTSRCSTMTPASSFSCSTPSSVGISHAIPPPAGTRTRSRSAAVIVPTLSLMIVATPRVYVT